MKFITQYSLIPIYDTNSGNRSAMNISVINLPSIILLGIIIILSLIGLVTNLG
jgi:hypothetical protein